MRIRGAVFAALEGAKGDGGHLYLDAEQLRKESMALLNSMIPVPQMRVKADDLEAVIDDMLLQGKIINSNGNYYLVKTFAQEDETARSIARLLCRPVERVDVQDLLTRVRRQLGVELSLRQTEAVHMVFRSDLSIITGSPGTGKTTVLKAVIEVFKLLKPSENILLAAPTGRASRRMAESTGVNNASTRSGRTRAPARCPTQGRGRQSDRRLAPAPPFHRSCCNCLQAGARLTNLPKCYYIVFCP